MNRNKKYYLALVFLLIFNSAVFAQNNTSARSLKKYGNSYVHSALDLTKAVIHHSASSDVSASTINLWHKQRGFDEIGYHFVIRTNGSIEKGRSLSKLGAHAKGRNNLVGICLTGKDKFSKAQIKSLITLLNDLGITHIERHHEECPGKGLNLSEIAKHLLPVKGSGIASFYTDTITANGERFDKNSLSCATRTGNYGQRLKVTNITNNKSVIVRNNDEGPHVFNRIIDLTPTAFKQIADIKQGIVRVQIETIK